MTDFSFNWTLWPFVEIDGEPIVLELARISPKLRTDLVDWCEQMLQNFDELNGFKNPQIQAKLNQSYEELCVRLTDEGVHFAKSIWWNKQDI